jgi:hypothetical protein
MIVSIEPHVYWISDCINDLQSAGFTFIAPIVFSAIPSAVSGTACGRRRDPRPAAAIIEP